MKLLSKSDIAKDKMSERKMDIDQGVSLARKIDTLRQTASEEEAKLSKFRIESLKQIHKDIEEIEEEKSTLTKEVKNLREEKERLQIPLDREWVSVRLIREEVEQQKESISKTVHGLRKSEKAYIKKIDELELEEQRIEDIKKSAIESYNQAETIKKDANKLLRDALSKEDFITTHLNERERRIEIKEEELKYREVDIENQLEDIKKVRLTIAGEVARVADQRETLARALSNHYKKS